MKRIAIIGTVGVPANYGGFETLVENIIGDNASANIEYTVFCSSKDCAIRPTVYKGAKLKHIGFHANGIQSIPYDILSLFKSIRSYDVVLILGVSGCIVLPLFKALSKSKVIVNIDGLEWKRDKWGKFAKWFLKLSEKVAVNFADVVVADNQGIVDHVQQCYNKSAELIAYGADHVTRSISNEQKESILAQYGLMINNYAITVCRIEPENNCDIILKAFADSGYPLIFIGNWNKSEYGRNLKAAYSQISNINIVDAVYDLDTLYVLRTNCEYYIHGHSAGGTNPSLVEAMYCRCNIIAYDVVYNRETTENKAQYFKNSHDLTSFIKHKDSYISNAKYMFDIANRRYTWCIIARQYASLYK